MRSTPSSVPAVALREVSKRFPGVLANDAVSLDIFAGEIHVLLGENGAGKSTLIALLAGMRQPDSGSIAVAGAPVRITAPGVALAHGIGTVFQHSLLVPSLSVIENLMLGGSAWRRLGRAAGRARFTALVAGLGVPLDPAARVSALPFGQLRLVEVMRALWHGVSVLVLDEPTALLAEEPAAALLALLRRLRDDGMAILLVTHRLQEACALGDRVTVLRRGRVVGRIDPERRRAMDAERFAAAAIGMLFGAADAAPLPAAARRLPAEGVAPRLRLCAVDTAPGAEGAALRAVDLAVRGGEICGIAGVDGSGQRALAEVIAGLRRPLAGRIALDGRDITGAGIAARRRAGLVHLSDDRLGEATVPALSVALNLLLGEIGAPPWWWYGLARWRRIGAHARALIAASDIRTPSEWTPVSALSGGNVQRLILARDLAAARRVAVFSRPTHGLDLRAASLARAGILDCAARGAAVILISDNLDELLQLADRTFVLSAGRLHAVDGGGETARRQIGRLMTGAAA